jgi:hypothetical protein
MCEDPEDCPDAPAGTAIPACVPLSGGGGAACLLDCGDGRQCPQGMDCIDLPNADLCMWP